MKPSEIKIGSTYRNKGAGKTTRTVLDIGEHVPPPWPGREKVCVKYRQDDKERTLFLHSFAAWAGSEVK